MTWGLAGQWATVIGAVLLWGWLCFDYVRYEGRVAKTEELRRSLRLFRDREVPFPKTYEPEYGPFMDTTPKDAA